MEYPLCDQTVTVYRKEGDKVCRQVAYGCYFSYQDSLVQEVTGTQPRRSFLLVMPGSTQRVFPGDRICAGEGPVIQAEDWDRFLPVLVPGLVETQWVKTYCLDGQMCHAEAGA